MRAELKLESTTIVHPTQNLASSARLVECTAEYRTTGNTSDTVVASLEVVLHPVLKLIMTLLVT
jgi:hypothetical protein